MSENEYIAEYGPDNEFLEACADDEADLVDRFFAKIEKQEARNIAKQAKLTENYINL